MNTIPHVLHFVTADDPGQAVSDRIRSISALHPAWAIRHWTDSNAPANGRLSRFYKRANSGAMLSDLMRLDALSIYGGIYIDADFVIHQKLDEIADHSQFFIGTEDGDNLTNALFGAVPNHPALEAIIDALIEQEPDWARPANEVTGPFLFNQVLHWRTDIDILPRETFYPYNWCETPKAAHRLSYGTHLWDGSWLPAKESLPQSKTLSSQTISTRVKIETAKFLSTIGFKKAGAFLWNEAYGISEEPETARAEPTAKTFTVGEEVFVRTEHGTILICDGRDLSITPHLALLGHYELSEELFLKNTLAGGDWYVDIGANIGNHAILAAKYVGPFGRVFAFEPNERCFKLMMKSAVVNWVHDRVKIRELGVSDSVGDANLVFSETQLGGAAIDTGAKQSDCLDVTQNALGDSKTLKIATTTLDAAFPVNLPIKILKIDAEGHEPAILRGAARLLSNRAVDFIMVEAIAELAGARWHEHLAGFQQLLDYGYMPARLSADGALRPHATLKAALDDDESRTMIFYIS